MPFYLFFWGEASPILKYTTEKESSTLILSSLLKDQVGFFGSDLGVYPTTSVRLLGSPWDERWG